MSTVRDLRALSNALKRDEQEIRIEDPAMTELEILSANSINAFTNMIKGGGMGAALAAGGIGVAALLGGFILPLGLLGAGLFKMAKGLTYDVAKGIKTDNDLQAAQGQIMSKYKGLDVKQIFKLIKTYYTITSEGKSYTVIKHK